jgi:hypothetical protein
MDDGDKWNVRKKGYLKIHIAVNVKTKEILSIEVTTDEHVHDSKALPELVENIIKSNSVTTTINKLFGNDAYEGKIFLNIYHTMEFCHVLKYERMLKFV